MDLRIEKTERGIKNAFIELRSKKPLEKITVKELCESARINKSTFYAHYKDIYDGRRSGTVDCEQYSASGISSGASGRIRKGTSDGLYISEFSDGNIIFRQSGESFCG